MLRQEATAPDTQTLTETKSSKAAERGARKTDANWLRVWGGWMEGSEV